MGKSGKGLRWPSPLSSIVTAEIGVRVRPLFGLNRLVKAAHRKRNGILHCDNVMCLSDTIAYSKSNMRVAP